MPCGYAALVEAAKSSDAVAKALADPKLEESLLGQLEHKVGQGDNRYVAEDAEGNARVALADPEPMKFVSDLETAREIRACTLPSAAE
jgi:hypothetical protein